MPKNKKADLPRVAALNGDKSAFSVYADNTLSRHVRQWDIAATPKKKLEVLFGEVLGRIGRARS